ncbi:spectrin repeat-containing domain protein [Dictyocaulus viviparus]|uniref:Spectrin repeat-containing domain protein n=1 Tax=Dictyocaulus viviparus TaxID=29172 RepID=A0A0D8XWN4_DICVI|nr:spectrin repeat-containing domain protein [Dictyocaulus viviparus]
MTLSTVTIALDLLCIGGHIYMWFIFVRVAQANGTPANAAPDPRNEEDDFANETLFFERNRIKQLQDERVHIQKKTFTKWCNSFLNRLENIGAEDILDRNERLILGLIWTIILRFQIDTIVIEDEEERGERKHAKDALLLWCQRKTTGYPNVRVENFTTSWRNGLAFNALIHAHRFCSDLKFFSVFSRIMQNGLFRPELVNFGSLNPNDHIGNLNNAFDIAEKKLEIARLLDAEDVDAARPDEKSIITYVSLYYHHFAKQKTELTGARRVANIVGKLMNSDTMEEDYEHISSDLLKWIYETIKQLENRRYKEKGELEALFFTIQTKRKAMGRKQYAPPQGLFMYDVESAWEKLDRAENDRQLAIIAELQRQERLEQLAQRFHKKANLREEERFKLLTTMCSDLCSERYYEADKIRARERNITERWTHLLSLLEQRRKSLLGLNDLMSLLRDIDTLSNELKHLEPAVRNRDVGKHLLGVEDLLGKHELIENQVNAQGSWLSNVTNQANKYIRNKGEQYDMLQRKLDEVAAQYYSLVELCRQRRLNLDKARALYQFVQDHEEQMSWLNEKETLCRRVLANGDVAAVQQTTLLHKNTETEMQSHWTRTKDMIAAGERLIENGQSREDIQRRIQAMQHGWERLRSAHQALGQWLNEAKQAQQYFQDANEAESWIREKMPLVKSDDLGRDEGAAESLLQRHTRLEEEIHAYRADIVRLEELSRQLANSSFHSATTSSHETEEVCVPQIEMLYKYEGNGMSVVKGEILALLEQSTPEWWRVLKQDGTEGFVPTNYCRIVPGEMVTVTQTTTKSSTEVVDSRRVIVDRQKMISADYRQLNNLAEIRRRLLSDNVKLMRFYRECDEFESWARETEITLADEPSVEHVKAFRKKFDQVEADMKAIGATQLKHINAMADELIAEGHSQSRQIETRQKKANHLWADLERLRAKRAAKLETTERVADFDSSCEDAREWMQGKFDLLDRNPNDLKSLQNLERDLKPLEDKIHYLEKLAAEYGLTVFEYVIKVKKKNPEEAATIERQIVELRALHSDLLCRAHEKIKIAEQSQGKEMFETALKDLLIWIDRTKKLLEDDVYASDVQQAEELLKKHYELGEQIKDKKYEAHCLQLLFDELILCKKIYLILLIDYVMELGRRLLDKNPRLQEVDDHLNHLGVEINSVKNMYRVRDAKLKEQLDLQLFNREAERIDATTKGHEAFLDYADLGDSVESVENLLKRHRDLEAKLDAQEGRLVAFSRNADDLIRSRHSESTYIDKHPFLYLNYVEMKLYVNCIYGLSFFKRREDVLARRAAVRQMAEQRRASLEASFEYQNIKRDAEEMIAWIHDKKKLANDDSHKDLSSIANKLLKHEAFEAEVGANSSRVAQINRVGSAMIAQKHYESMNVDRLLKRLNSEWTELHDAVERKGEKLRQAADQKGLNRILEDAHSKLDELEIALKSDELGSDLRAVKDLIQKHSVVEQEMGIYEKKVWSINHNHLKFETGCCRFENLEGPASARRGALEESRKWHQLSFDVDCELQWISEKKLTASSEDTGRNLTESLNMVKKQDQLEAEIHKHAEHIEKTITQGESLINVGHKAAAQIKAKCEQLAAAWAHLTHLVRKRRQIVDWGVKEHQYMFDAVEVEAWMNEKRAALESHNYGQDEDAAQKLLAKHRALQKDMQTYRQWLEKLATKCSELITSSRPNVERFTVKQEKLETEFDRLSRLAEERLRALEDSVHLFEYIRESVDLEQWINEQLQMAMNEEYGDDYEHFKELQSKFEDFKQNVKTGSERFVICESAANALLRRNPPFGRDILKKQEKLRSVWTLLLDYIESRESKLNAAEELHRFNQDVLEHEEWVADKRANIFHDKGRSMQQNLLAESARLREAYPGGNAEHIAQQQTELADSWQELRNAIEDRRDELRAARDMHRFNADVRDVLAWADITIADMQTEMHVNGLQQAEVLKKEHSRLRGEITTRAPEFERVIRSGEAMIQRGHFDSHNIGKRVQQINTALDHLRSEWELRESYLVQLVQWHAFQQEANQIFTLISSKRATLRQLAVGGSVADVEGQKKRLDTFEKALSTLDERTKVLDLTANELVTCNHMEKSNIELSRKKVIPDLLFNRIFLFFSLAIAKIVVPMNFFMWFLCSGQCSSIEDKMKRLQKHQALEAELAANRKRIEQVLQKGKELHMKHRDAGITSRCDGLYNRWVALVDASAEQSRALEEARDLLSFRQVTCIFHPNVFVTTWWFRVLFIIQVDRVLTWAHERELMVTAADMGRDLEHCKLLLDRLDGTQADSSVDEQTLEQINRLGEKLIGQGRTNRDEVQQQQQNLNHIWSALHGKLASYRRELLAAFEVHTFNRDVDDTNERILEKITAMRSDDYGRDFATVDALLRKQTALERDMSAIHQKLIAHDKDAQNILAKKPPLMHTILDSLKKLEDSWKELSQAADLRNEHLDKSYKLYKYIDQVKKAEQWATQLRNKMTSYQSPKTSAEAEQLIAQHAERKAEIDGRQGELHILHEEGQRLIAEQPEHKSEVQRAHKRVQNSEHQLRQTWEAEKASLQRMLEWLHWCDQASMCERWLTDKENLLKQGDIGDASDVVQMLIKSHDALEETVLKQSEKLDRLKADASHLISSDNEYRGDVEARCEEVMQRYAAMLELSSQRRSLLYDSKKYHDFIRTCGELITWINAKLQIAYDESYLDPTNLRAKLQKHLAFDSELTENEKRLVTVEAQGEQLIKEKHFMSGQVRAQLGELRSGWDELRTKSALKTQRLREAYEAYTLQRKVEDMEKWLNRGRADAVRDLMQKAREIKTLGSPTSDVILRAAEQVDSRYSSLNEPVMIRRENLRDAHAMYKWTACAEEELEWLADRLPLARSQECGDSLHAAHSLQKKHAALEKEIESRQIGIHEIESKGVAMVRAKHFASIQIEQTIDRLTTALLSIKDAASVRRTRLQQAVDSHEYYTEVAEAEQWIKDQMPVATNQETGRDQTSAEGYLRRLTVLDKEVAARQAKLETIYAELVKECNRRRTQLVDAARYHRFVRQVDDLSDWLRDKEHLASSEDYGRDLEDCVQLTEKFETVVRELAAAGERVAAVQRAQEELLRSGHPYAASIRAKGTDLQSLWTSVNEAATERQHALAGARQVHRFDQEADETLNWLQDKEATGVAIENEDLAHADLATIKIQMQRHEEFVHGMRAVEKQVAELCREAERLWTAFPNTREHLEVRKMDMEEQLKDILEGTKRHHERLQHMESMQAYFQEYRELMQWMKKMQAVMISEPLPRDVIGCEALARRHDEYNLEMQGRKPHVYEFIRQGKHVIQAGHVLSQEIGEKVKNLERSWEVLCEVWKDRHDLYNENLDCQRWKQNAAQLEQWLIERERMLGDDWRHIDTVEGAESHLRDFDDFLVTLDTQVDRCEMVKRLTLIEQNFSRLRKKEVEKSRIAEEDQRRRDTIKVVEKGQILANRRQERERRKTQARNYINEISLLRPNHTDDFSSQTLPKKTDRMERSKTSVLGDTNMVGGVGGPSIVGALSTNTSVISAVDVDMKKTPSFTTRRGNPVTKSCTSRFEDMGVIDMKG